MNKPRYRLMRIHTLDIGTEFYFCGAKNQYLVRWSNAKRVGYTFASGVKLRYHRNCFSTAYNHLVWVRV